MRNLEEFIEIIDLDKNLCSSVLDFLTSPESKWKDHWFTDSSTYKETPASNPENILVTRPYEKNNLLPLEVGRPFHDMLWEKIPEYLNNIEKIQLPGKEVIDPRLNRFSKPYRPNIKAMSMVRFNKYKVGSYMSKHIDHIHSLFEGEARGIPILSLLVLLNDNFTGGKFKLNNEHINIKKNQLLMFPSIFLYEHYVEPILSGERYTAVSWAY